MWFDGLWVSVFFGSLHLAIIRFGCSDHLLL
jgi:hypothetical protein